MPKKNWRTTVVGIFVAIGILSTQVTAVLDTDPKTVFDMQAVFAALGSIGLGWFAKDAGQSGVEK